MSVSCQELLKRASKKWTPEIDRDLEILLCTLAFEDPDRASVVEEQFACIRDLHHHYQERRAARFDKALTRLLNELKDVGSMSGSLESRIDYAFNQYSYLTFENPQVYDEPYFAWGERFQEVREEQLRTLLKRK